MLKLSVRTFTEPVRDTVLTAIRRILEGEAAASGAPAPPEITVLDSFPVVVNDPEAMGRTLEAFRGHFGEAALFEVEPATGSEDVGVFAKSSGAPLAYWLLGGTDPQRFAEAEKAGTVDADIPANHSPLFAPVPEPTIRTGVQAMAVAALTWLRR